MDGFLPVGFSGEDFQTMLALLLSRGTVLDLPQATFDLVVPHLNLGNDAQTFQTLSSDVRVPDDITNNNGYNGTKHQYDSQGIHASVHLALARIHRLSTLPNATSSSSSQLDLMGLVLQTFDDEILRCSCGPLLHMDQLVEFIDGELRSLVVSFLSAARESGGGGGGEWDFVEWFVWVKGEGDGVADRRNGSEDLSGTFVRTLGLLRGLHSRSVGGMLAEKVVGHLLPVELVEMVGECFYDKRLLALLGV